MAAVKSGRVEGGRWVRIMGLKSSSGQVLNGRVGQVLNNEANADGRFQILIDGYSKGKLIKASNIDDVPRNDLVKTCRISAKGEGCGWGKFQTGIGEIDFHKVLLFPRDHSMFTECVRGGNVPVMRLLGLPLMLQKVKSYTDLSEFGAADNQKATYLMIEPHNGFAPLEWLNDVGPVLVFRPGGLDLSYDDMIAINSYYYNIIDNYAEEDCDPSEWLNKEFFQRNVKIERDCGFTDLNILVEM